MVEQLVIGQLAQSEPQKPRRIVSLLEDSKIPWPDADFKYQDAIEQQAYVVSSADA